MHDHAGKKMKEALHALHGPQECDHATHRAMEGPDAIERAEEACRRRGVRMTPIRREVLAALYMTHRPLGAYDIADIMGRETERRIAPITIYRALEFLLEQGFIHKLETRNAFIACPHDHLPGELVVFLICDICGGVDETGSPEVSSALSRVLSKAGFSPANKVVEIAGVCSHCREAGHAAAD